MPRTIEHKIKIIGSTNPSGNVSEYGTIEREKNANDFGHQILHSQGNNLNKSENRKADEITYGTECFERSLHYSPNEIEREQFSCRNFGERCSFGGEGDLNEHKKTKKTINPINHNYNNQNPFSHPMHGEEWNVFESDEDISGNETKKGEEEMTKLNQSKQLKKIEKSKINNTNSINEQFNYKNNELYNNHNLPNYFKSLPMKRIIKKSRLVSIHDGRPLSNFVETVHYEPADINYYNNSNSQMSSSPLPEEPQLLNYYSSSCSLSDEDENIKNKILKKKKNSKNNSKIYLTQNPLYSL